jgi:hypothetical protein
VNKHERLINDSKDNPQHPGLQFKRVHPVKPIYSVRINNDYRALGVRKDNIIIWFWIGSHALAIAFKRLQFVAVYPAFVLH